ncbi:hypothetical protein AA23498_1459 [Acetobacter nitrogenifigens DSM 23921 = NBRC 105050]|uniref:Uncharacterized protein n=1 Tax=Acetobacter nitrogenifigens DSM 23921 = NBRC 105050 TaxID=1120919 RepID=A0A511XF27_9PROT|nr:hypothetical protein [Acetobacter nitrogenifigens]GBQ92463.1 hypothetical protein AA23498_1459 [Acetobacter nitrogenifigens DSM 23921 = NBRC 105050]GEN61564.1 hypothetical protein ANI02nite_34480 [Acetobacter nitrogenifigens DSM 23921 = NBRC 105050]
MNIPGIRSVIVLLATALGTQASAATVVLGGYPDQIQFIDDSTGHVVQKVTMETGLPSNIQLSADQSKIYVMTLTSSGFEVLDAKTHKVVNHFTLNTPTLKYRFLGGVADPAGRYFYTLGWRIDKLNDRFRFGKPQYIVVDLKEHKVSQAVDVSDEDGSGNRRPSFGVSPDGKIFYIFDKQVRVVDTHDMKVTKRIDLAKPDPAWKQDINIGTAISTLGNASQYVSLFMSQDPYIHNKTFGVGRFDLTNATYKFDPIGAAPNSVEGLQVTPDGKDGYTVVENGEYGNQRCEFWHYDLSANIAVGHTEFPCRRRFYFGMSRNGKKLYIYGAGYDVAVYDAKTLKPETDWELGNDITMAGIINLP